MTSSETTFNDKELSISDATLDALVKQAMDRAIDRLQKLHSHAGRPAWDQVLREELSEPFTTLLAQLAGARANDAALAEIRKTLAAPDGWHPVDAVKALKRSHDRAEQRVANLEAALSIANATLAAQIEVDAGIADAQDLSVMCCTDADIRARIIAVDIRAQPHDRTALDRMMAEAREQTALGMVDVMATTAKEAREKALREAAGACDWGDIYGDNAVRVILALIEKKEG